jgi:hypothetical protein
MVPGRRFMMKNKALVFFLGVAVSGVVVAAEGS